MDDSERKEQYNKLLLMINELKKNMLEQVDSIDELYGNMINNCSINDNPLEYSNLERIKRELNLDIEFIDSRVIEEINEKMNIL